MTVSRSSWRPGLASLLFLALVGHASAQRGADNVLRVRQVLEDTGAVPSVLALTRRGLDVPQSLTLPPSRRGAPRPKVLLAGYWPPSNEMLREFSDDPVQNPGGWVGNNWEGRGYDLHSFFPEFQPPDCSNCGQGSGDLEVDYQDTSQDFWAIANSLEPIAIITFSRGFLDLSWEVEMNQYNRVSWINDFTSPHQPTPTPPDGNAPPGLLRLSALPVQDIVDAVDQANLGLTPFICYSDDGGGFLSEFLAYHGVWYQNLHSHPCAPTWCVAAGHVHVGGQITWPVASEAAKVTIRTVLDYVDAVLATTVFQQDLGFGGPGLSRLCIGGEPLATGNVSHLLLANAPPSTPAWMFVGTTFAPTPFRGGMLVPLPPALIRPLPIAPDGTISLRDLPGGGGPFSIFLQILYPDPLLAQGIGFSNALQIDLQP